MSELGAVCVFCGSRTGTRSELVEAAQALGALLAQRGITLVYGGASIGLMGNLADAALATGGRVIGVMPDSLADREIAHHGLTELRFVPTLAKRKATMADLADAFVALPGGFGTLDELFEMVTWTQLGLQAKPAAVLDVDGYFAGLLTFLDRAVDDGLVKPSKRRILVSAPDAAGVLDRLESWEPA